MNERDIVNTIVNRIYNQTSVALTDEQLDDIVGDVLIDERWAELTDSIAERIYNYNKHNKDNEMTIKFTQFHKNDNWVTGLVNNGEYFFSSKLFDGGSTYGINEGRVSKLNISVGDRWTGFDNCIVNYDRGWDIRPNNEDEKKVYLAVLDFLENAPTTRFE